MQAYLLAQTHSLQRASWLTPLLNARFARSGRSLTLAQLRRIFLGPPDHNTKAYGFKDRGGFL